MAKKSAIDDREKEEALKKLIRETVVSAGVIAPDDIPHRVKDRIRKQASSEAKDSVPEKKSPKGNAR